MNFWIRSCRKFTTISVICHFISGSFFRNLGWNRREKTKHYPERVLIPESGIRPLMGQTPAITPFHHDGSLKHLNKKWGRFFPKYTKSTKHWTCYTISWSAISPYYMLLGICKSKKLYKFFVIRLFLEVYSFVYYIYLYFILSFLFLHV